MPAGRCVSPLLWSLDVNELLRELNDNWCYETVGYADDIALLINRIFSQTVSEILQRALGIVKQRCSRTNLSINPNETVLIPFTRKRDIIGLKEPALFSKTVQLPSEFKHLGLTLDMGKAAGQDNRLGTAFWTCRGTFGGTSDLRQTVVHWMYTVVISPTVTDSATVWWPRAKLRTANCKGCPAWVLPEQGEQLQQL
jgi:hypothetical protein